VNFYKPWSNMKILMLFHDFDVIGLLFHDFDVIGSVIPWFDKRTNNELQKNKYYYYYSYIFIKHQTVKAESLYIKSDLPKWSPLLSSHLYSKVTFFLSCHRKLPFGIFKLCKHPIDSTSLKGANLSSLKVYICPSQIQWFKCKCYHRIQC
jgi:hypothetical protein